MKKHLIITLLSLFFVYEGFSQSFFNNKYNRRVLATGGAGITSYYGDLNDPGDIIDTHLNLSISLMYMITPQIAIEGEAYWFRLRGSDAESEIGQDHIERNLSFVSNNTEFSVTGNYYFLPNGTRYYQRQPINPYVFGGVGITHFKPKAELNGVTYPLRPLQTEGVSYGPIAVVFPMGAGVRIMVTPSLNISIEGGVRFALTDYLDDVSTEYVDNASFDDPIAAALADRAPELGYELRGAGSKRGNPDRNDAYFGLNGKIEYFIPELNFGGQKRPGGGSYKRRRMR